MPLLSTLIWSSPAPENASGVGSYTCVSLSVRQLIQVGLLKFSFAGAPGNESLCGNKVE